MYSSFGWGILAAVWSVTSGVDWVVHIRTADQDKAGTNADVRIQLFGDNAEVSSKIKLNNLLKDPFKRGNNDKFEIQQGKTNGFSKDTKVTRIGLWKSSQMFGVSPSWKCDRVVVENRLGNINFTFPVISWIQPKRSYLFNLYDTCLPQNELLQEQRSTQLEDARQDYQFAQRFQAHGLDNVGAKPPIPADDQFSLADQLQIAKALGVSTLKSKIIPLFKSLNTWDSIESIKDMFKNTDDTLPEGLDNWGDDVHFGLQRMTGNNIDVLELYQDVSDSFPVTDELLGSVLEGLTIQEAITQKRLFVCDFKILQGIPSKTDFVQCAPFGLFFVDKNKHLKPIAIQLFQEPGPENPIFTPKDPLNTWLMAKMWFNNADAAFHESASHFGGTHLVLEGIVVATHRNLARSHPIFKFLAPHFLYQLSINTLGNDLLLGEQHALLEKVMNINSNSVFEIVGRHLQTWRMDVHGNLPELMKRRGVEDPNVLPGFGYRDDGMLVYDVIYNYAREYVDVYYTDTDVLDDVELQTLVQDIVRPTDDPIPGCGLKGVPGNGKLTTTDQLVQLLTSIIWINTGQHAAVMNKNYVQYAFPPNCPMQLHGSPPKSKLANVTERDILGALPDRAITGSIAEINKQIVLMHTRQNPLGDFEVDYVADPQAVKVVEKFRDRLNEVSETIKERNTLRDAPYTSMDPKNIRNSIAA